MKSKKTEDTVALKPTINKTDATPEHVLSINTSASDHLRRPLTTKTWQQSAVQNYMLRVTVDGLILRDIPDTHGQEIFKLVRYTLLRVGTEESQFSGDLLWRNVISGSIKGWVLASGIELFDYPLNAHAALNTTTPLEHQGGTSAPVSQEFVDINSSIFSQRISTSAGNAHQLALHRVMLNDLALRANPDINARLLKKLPEGQIVECLPQTVRGSWAAIQVDGHQGWAAHHWLQPVTPNN